jgi:sulfate/thiosulfate transport system permease protein
MILLKRRWIKYLLLSVAVSFLSLVVVLPLAAVFAHALEEGLGPYLDAVTDAETWSAIRLTLLVAAIAVPANTVFGVACAWLLARYDFRGKGLLSAIVDVPFSVSPVIAGLLFVLLFGRSGLLPASSSPPRSSPCRSSPER